MIVAVALSPSLDVTYEVGALRHGDITRPDRVTRVAGGKALNVARVARALGAEVRVIAALGGHTGAWIAEMLEADGIALDAVRLALPTRECLAIVEASGGSSSTDLYEIATPLRPEEWSAFAAAADAVAEAGPSWIAVSGSLPAGVPVAEFAALLVRLREAGSRVAVDSSAEGLSSLGPVADLVKVNRAEATAVLDAPHLDARGAADALRARWGCDVVVTDGVRGGHALLAGADHPLAAPAEPGRFSAGSGDAFLGGLLASLDRGSGADAALDAAREAAERNARIPGQGLLAD